MLRKSLLLTAVMCLAIPVAAVQGATAAPERHVDGRAVRLPGREGRQVRRHVDGRVRGHRVNGIGTGRRGGSRRRKRLPKCSARRHRTGGPRRAAIAAPTSPETRG